MRKLFIILVSLTLTLLVGYAGYRGYKVWKQNRMMNLARAFAEKKDGRNALLSLQQVLRSNPRHLEACRMMANFTEASRSPAAVLWRSRIVELNPRSTDDRLALVQTAMMFRDLTTATNALAAIDAPGKSTFAYHNLAGTLAAGMNEPVRAESHFREAIRIQPSNVAAQLNLAVIHLNATNSLDREEGRVALKRVVANPTNTTLRCQALRELVADAMRGQQPAAALALANDLLKQTNSTFSDKILRLEILRASTNSELKSALASCQNDAADSPAQIHELATWQMAKTPPRELLTWLQTLPEATRTNQPVALLLAECQTMLGDWAPMNATLQRQNWAELNFVRHAFLARALRGQQLAAAAKSEWDLAVRAANDQKASLLMLLRMAAAWKWNNEAETLLTTVANQFPEEKWAVRALTRAHFEAGRTRPLMILLNQQLKKSPADMDVKNNLAMTALLLDAQELKPHDMARDIYQKAATNAAFASTYAFSLHLQKKNGDALKVFERLSPAELENPGIAGYYGMILKASGNAAKGNKYLDLSAKAPMLPEERKLMEKARAL